MQQVIDFVLEMDKLKAVTRKVRPLGLERYENSAEHSWQLAMFAVSLAHEVAAQVDVHRVVQILLVHDVTEIDTGDVIAYAETGWEERRQAEHAAALRIFGILPEEQKAAMLALWHEFDRDETPEAHFAHAIDRAMPVLLNLANGGQTWQENGISYERVVKRIAPPIQKGCPALWEYLQPRLDAAREKGFFGA